MTSGDVVLYVIVACMIVLLVLAVSYAVNGAGGKEKKASRHAREIYGRDRFRFLGLFPLAGGLSLPEGVPCCVARLSDGILVEAEGQQFWLPDRRLTGVSVLSRQEAERYYVSSAGGAVAGGMAFGALGAALGGRIRKKTVRKRQKFLIITYLDKTEENTGCLVFDAGKSPSVSRFVQLGKELRARPARQIEL